nr:MAG TPA: hypothetical protein [Ackermannviridae sp.]
MLTPLLLIDDANVRNYFETTKHFTKNLYFVNFY